MDTVQEYLSRDFLQHDAPDVPSPVAPAPTIRVPEFLRAKTGPGAVDEYINHPLNIAGNEDFARIIRGLTGMFNSLDYAVVDILVGVVKFAWGRYNNAIPGA